jgi:hypothetical protein
VYVILERGPEGVSNSRTRNDEINLWKYFGGGWEGKVSICEMVVLKMRVEG